jgi:hypothetical protein
VNASFTLELRGDSFIAPVSDIPLGGGELSALLVAVASRIVAGVGSGASCVSVHVCVWVLGMSLFIIGV